MEKRAEETPEDMVGGTEGLHLQQTGGRMMTLVHLSATFARLAENGGLNVSGSR